MTMTSPSKPFNSVDPPVGLRNDQPPGAFAGGHPINAIEPFEAFAWFLRWLCWEPPPRIGVLPSGRRFRLDPIPVRYTWDWIRHWHAEWMKQKGLE
jgi:hypothetical protein